MEHCFLSLHISTQSGSFQQDTVKMGAEQDAEVTRFVDRLIELHRVLSRLDDLRPCQSVNELFGELVGLCTQTLSTSTTNEVSCPPFSSFT
jgi:hypothetical protein